MSSLRSQTKTLNNINPSADPICYQPANVSLLGLEWPVLTHLTSHPSRPYLSADKPDYLEVWYFLKDHESKSRWEIFEGNG